MKRLSSSVILTLALALFGCGGSSTTVNGKITYKEQALNSGTITWSGADGAKSFPISDTGAYTAKGLTPGIYKVAVSTPNMAPPIVGPPGDKKGTKAAPPVQVDAKYHKVETSGLEYEVKGGSQEINISLPK